MLDNKQKHNNTSLFGWKNRNKIKPIDTDDDDDHIPLDISNLRRTSQLVK